MKTKILNEMEFRGPAGGWEWPPEDQTGIEISKEGCKVSPPSGKTIEIKGPGVHTKNGDTIELVFRLFKKGKGKLQFGFEGGFEFAQVTLDFQKGDLFFSTSDWRLSQPVEKAKFPMKKRNVHVLALKKTEGDGKLVRNAAITVYFDEDRIASFKNVNILPEMGVCLSVTGTTVFLKRFVHKGIPSGIPEYLTVGGWQVPNTPSIEDNLTSLCKGLRKAAKKNIQLLVTPETSMTGLFPRKSVTKKEKPIQAAEKKLRKFIAGLKNAPYLITGLPVWVNAIGRQKKKTRVNVSRVYDPDGKIVSTHAKFHSCEWDFWHGYRLMEFDIYGVPTTMHICHDTRYPEVWTLPVMFGARLILHPANSGPVRGSIDAFEAMAKKSTVTSHAFYVHVNGNGGSFIASPQKYDNLVDVGSECWRTSPSFPMIGEAKECLIYSELRIHDAFGYWPVRSFRVSKKTAEAYKKLYKSLGGIR